MSDETLSFPSGGKRVPLLRTSTKYRVVGVHPDGSRRILADGISQRIARTIQYAIGGDVFVSVVVERDESPIKGRDSGQLFPPSGTDDR
jgi:hypothetical protein